MGARFKSLSQLGRGAWRIRETSARANRHPRGLKKGARSSPPEQILAAALVNRFGKRVVPSYKKAVPKRRFVIDVAIPDAMIAIEIDGWQYHGKHLRDFKRDREKDRQLTLAGWRVLRFTAGEVFGDVRHCVKVVERVLIFTYA